MLISKPLESAINTQVGNEFGASMQYISIAAYFDNEDLEELAAWARHELQAASCFCRPVALSQPLEQIVDATDGV